MGLVLICPTLAWAGNTQGGMQTLEILTPEQEKHLLAPKTQTTAPTSPATAQGTHHIDLAPSPSPAGKPAPGATAGPTSPPPLVPTQDLRPWANANALYTARGNAAARTALINDFNAAPGAVAPAQLLQLAVIVADTGDMKTAAKLYYAAQLRIRFDYARWPLKAANNPYRQFTEDLRDQGKDIAGWAATSSTRLGEVMESVRVWDASTPYAYLPEYKLPPSPPAKAEKDWPDLLAQTRTQFFTDAGKITDALRTMGR